MMWDRLKYLALAAVLAVGLAGFGILQWVSASDGPGDRRRPAADEADTRVAVQLPSRVARDKEPASPPAAKEAPKADEGKAGTAGRRREAVIRLPSGTFVKEVDASPYGSGRLTWTYEDERVTGLIEGVVMGVEFEVAVEAEYSLSSNGTIYGLVTGFRLNHLKFPDTGELAEEFAELKPFVGLWPVVEPLVNEVMTDLPFSYQFRVQGDRLVISNYRILLSGPNPLGKVGLLTALDGNEAAVALAAFQGLGTAIEGTYTAADAAEPRPAPGKRPLFMKPRGRAETKAGK